MDQQEYQAWQAFMKASRGKWTVDPIHNGVDRDLIAFRPNTDDHTKGVYIMVDGAKVSAGRYEEALESVTNGIFIPYWQRTFTSAEEALKTVIERMGVDFLIDIIR
jgi:hypothetical protein